MDVFDFQVLVLLDAMKPDKAVEYIDRVFPAPEYGLRPAHYDDSEWRDHCWSIKTRFENDIAELIDCVRLKPVVLSVFPGADVFICPEQECLMMRMPDEAHAHIAAEEFDGFSLSYDPDQPCLVRLDAEYWMNSYRTEQSMFRAVRDPYRIIREYPPGVFVDDTRYNKPDNADMIPAMFLPLMSFRNLKPGTAYQVGLPGMCSRNMWYVLRKDDEGFEWALIFHGPITADEMSEASRTYFY